MVPAAHHKPAQPPITIRSERAVELLRKLVGPGRSQAQVIEQALEQMAAGRRSLAALLTPDTAIDFDWEPPRANSLLSSHDWTRL